MQSAPRVQAALDGLAPSTRRAYMADTEYFRRFFCEHRRESFPTRTAVVVDLLGLPPDVGTSIVTAYVASLKGDGYDPKTIDRRLTSLRWIVGALALEEPGVRFPGTQRQRYYEHTSGTPLVDVEHLFAHLSGDDTVKGMRDHALLALLHYAALRPAEVLKLRVADIGFVERALWVASRRHRKPWGERVSRDRVPLRPEVRAPLEAWLARQGCANPIWTSFTAGVALTSARTIQRVLARRCEQAGIVPTVARELRHAGIRRAIAERSPACGKRLARMKNDSIFRGAYLTDAR